MIKPLSLFLFIAFAWSAKAQTAPQNVPGAMPYGKIDMADLEMKACDFEKDVNAEVLFNKGDCYFDQYFETITNVIHKRIKIFNDEGKNEADVHIEYYSGNQYEYIRSIQAETINLVNGKIEITKVDKKSIFTKIIDKAKSEIVFSFPNVRPGSVIEYKYEWNTNAFYHMPTWYFQDKLPVRYSEFSTSMPEIFYFREHYQGSRDLVKDTHKGNSVTIGSGVSAITVSLDDELRAMVNIHSLPDEPFMSSYADNVKCLSFQFVSNKPIGGFVKTYSDTWAKVGGALIDDEDFGAQLRRKLNNEQVIIDKAKTLKNDDEKISYLFNKVRDDMTWNGSDSWYTSDGGTPKAWEKKTGNSADINLILYHLLKQSGVEAYPMVVSTREHGRVHPYYTSLSQFNRAVVYVPVDSTKEYVLDATDKYNAYNQVPAELLNSSGLYIDKPKNLYDIIKVTNNLPARQVVLINGEIKPDGKLTGTAEISSSGYNKISVKRRYKKDGEKKYIDYLQDGDNNLKIASVAFENMDVDTLPTTQKIDFKLDLTGSDENYIYLNANLFSSLKNNQFLNETRMTDIDFGYQRNFSINGNFKVPAGYKTDALPKNLTMVTPDKSIVFKRVVAEADGAVVIRYNVNYNKAEYSKTDYDYFHEFLKKMYEMLNEQIVFKKS